jgi:hypothetical protein
MPRPAPYDPEKHKWPKRVYPDPKSKKGVTVQDQAAYDAVMGKGLVSEPDNKDALIATAEREGVTIDKRWGTDKIKAALVEAGKLPA